MYRRRAVPEKVYRARSRQGAAARDRYRGDDARKREVLYTTPLIDKLGVRPGAKVAVLGVREEGFQELLRARTDDVSARPRKDADLVFLAADSAAELARLRVLEPLIRRGGAIWVVSRKGKAATVRDVDVIDAAREAGLVDNKVVAFSETHTALRLVVPRARR